MYQALYRKWRPKTFDDGVGQEDITATLKNEVAAGKFSHAYLFTGSRGTGKTTCSKIVAKAVNCERPVDGNPCNECAACRGIDDGSVLDVVEIDAASNNGVDNIRQLREEAYFLPSVVKYRVYILDECHMLSQGAVNALLKILEEPPEHVVFILATTEIHKVLPTILSRCQRFDFHRIRSRVIADRLLYIAEQESFSLADDAALLIARLSDGGMRDALSLLDLCASFGTDITVQAVTQAAGLAGQSHLFEIADAAIARDPAAALLVVGRLSRVVRRAAEHTVPYHMRACKLHIHPYPRPFASGFVFSSIPENALSGQIYGKLFILPSNQYIMLKEQGVFLRGDRYERIRQQTAGRQNQAALCGHRRQRHVPAGADPA